MSALSPVPDPLALSLLAATAQAREYAKAAKAENTRRAYRADWEAFSAWCAAHQRTAMPATGETVALFLAAEAEQVKVSTLTRRLSAISQLHQAQGWETPTRDAVVRAVLSGIRRSKGAAPRGKRPVMVNDLQRISAALPATTQGTRDRALLLLGFAGAFRRSELVSLHLASLEWAAEGLVVRLARSKTDQEGMGRAIGIPRGMAVSTCPVRAMEAWLAIRGAQPGPLFMAVDRQQRLSRQGLSDRAVALIVKRAAQLAGLDPRFYAGHSLRAGLATAAAAAGVEERAIMDQTGHRSVAMVRRYIREGSVFRNNAAGRVGL